jgi:hypothetical protein
VSTVKKILMVLFVMVLATVLASPAFAQYTPEEPPPSKGFIEINYEPLILSGSTTVGGVAKDWSANFNALRANAEFVVYRGIGAGVDFTLGNSSTQKLAGIDRSDAKFTDTILYAKVPLNVSSLYQSETEGYATPPPSEFKIVAGYKMHYLVTEQNPKATWVSASGIGIGLAFDSPIQKIRLEGQVIYYPQMIVQNAATEVGTYAYYRDLSWRLALKTRLNDRMDASLGYCSTTQSSDGGSLYYTGFTAGFRLKF